MKFDVAIMQSYSRSGETLLLRTLNAHPRIHAVHDLRKTNSEEELALFEHLRRTGATAVAADSKLARHVSLPDGGLLLLKNAVWLSPPVHTRGFVLVRNPFSVAASAGVIGESPARRESNRRIIMRWARGIAPGFVAALDELDNLAALLLLWNVKVTEAMRSGLPVVHYERFVADPQRILRTLIAGLGLPWNDAVLTAHEAYAPGEKGHGRMPLSAPIHQKSRDSYRDLPDEVFDRIHALVYPTLRLCGYVIEGRTISIASDFDDRLTARR
ncbi:sulfotransferase [Pikeienuella piscinae]|uniref:Sulfotransferase n=1 Tax=Pikeienuella piscinae TaxID=2748098 RepID=A0A7L5BW56_9RHOB|nr:sulfotransferase [Pikeienuella piscinae]QIE54114.1 sulfotransferase [Pikeienuella piscinae]